MAKTSTKKFSASMVGGALAVVGVWAVKQFAGIEIPAEVATAIGVLATVGASAIIPDRLEE